MPTPADEWLAGDIPEEPLTPETLRFLFKALEPLRGTAVATGNLEDGTDMSIAVRILIDDGYAHADQWQRREQYIKSLENRLAIVHQALIDYRPRQALELLNATARPSDGG